MIATPKIIVVRVREYGNISYSYIDFCEERRGPKYDSCGDPAGRIFYALYRGGANDEEIDEDMLVTADEYRKTFPKQKLDYPADSPVCWKRREPAERAAKRMNEANLEPK